MSRYFEELRRVVNDLFKRLLEAADQQRPIDLDDVSEADAQAALADLEDHPMAADVFFALVRSESKLSRGMAVRLVAATPDPAAMAGMVQIFGGMNLSESLISDLNGAVIGHAENRELHPATRSQALLGALLSAQNSDRRRLRLQLLLADISDDDDPDFLRHVAKIAGLIHAHHPDRSLRSLLERLVLVEGAHDEAAVELGLMEIRSALEQRDGAAALEAFTKARDWFAQSIERSEARPDAELYLLSLNMLLDFQKGRRAPPSSEEALMIRKAAFNFAAFSTPSAPGLRDSWLGERVEETHSWQELALTLAQLSQSLLDDVWLNVSLRREPRIFGLPLDVSSGF